MTIRPRAIAFSVTPIGTVAAGFASRDLAPKQGAEGAPEAWIDLHELFIDGMDGIEAGNEVLVLTWLLEAERDVLRVHQRDDITNRKGRGLRHQIGRPAEPHRDYTAFASSKFEVTGCRSIRLRPSSARPSLKSSRFLVPLEDS